MRADRALVIPGLLALSASLGLVGALVGDGWWDAVSWIALVLPLMAALRRVK